MPGRPYGWGRRMAQDSVGLGETAAERHGYILQLELDAVLGCTFGAWHPARGNFDHGYLEANRLQDGLQQKVVPLALPIDALQQGQWEEPVSESQIAQACTVEHSRHKLERVIQRDAHRTVALEAPA